ncbi:MULTISPECIES: TauD/TfdA family dioxygenase [unclassified Bradyrhizobium]|uniref:TauD/TfdA dioxygenase family protein n=1 Tax=unclassified Bradyrhizobium TaxID=2631580 RepID=UPI00244CD9EF|nr:MULTISPECIES: TauD/TfdA family dioxygenase [unclassified Bradyrhizobium]MDH2344065.1 TauD/TfdA family dioxygenase [Bradyrhizobium sp. SSUT77]MDH2350342.1 TauD/TfdA family dioxygenase [Bradyrhizobium sp. SSUT112]
MTVVLEQSVAETAKSHQNLSIRPYKPLIGAVIDNVDLAKPLSDRNRQELNRALVEHGVIFIRRQALNDAQHVELASVFGKPIRKNIYLPSVSAFPEIEVIAHDEHTKSGGTDNWHVDVSWQREPPKATVLHIKQVPAGGGGDTIWASSSAAYDLLDPDLARYFEKLTAVNTFLASPKKAALSDLLSGYAAGREETAEQGRARVNEASVRFPPIEVPVVKTHPETGRKLIFVNEAHTSHLLGVSKTASQSLLNYLYDVIKTPEIQARFEWQEGDVAIWDNRQVQHYAVRDYGKAPRRIHRVTLEYDGVF